MVSADGGTPRELIADDPELKYDADWSADGKRIVFANGPANPNSSIRMLDVKTNQLSSLPDSTGLYSPRWSPNGRYIAAMNADSRVLMLYDFQAQKWQELARVTMGFPNCRKIQIMCISCMKKMSLCDAGPSPDHKVERIADLKDFRQAGFFNFWLGMAPDDFRCYCATGARRTSTLWILKNRNQDGFADIGTIKEEIHCPEGEEAGRVTRMSNTHFWCLYTADGWKREQDDSGGPDHYAELPLVGMDKSPGDFVGRVLW
jgi:WD40 repeat protein